MESDGSESKNGLVIFHRRVNMLNVSIRSQEKIITIGIGRSNDWTFAGKTEGNGLIFALAFFVCNPAIGAY